MPAFGAKRVETMGNGDTVKRRVSVVGAGNAARQGKAAVTVVERAPRPERGGNSRFAMASMRFACSGPGGLQEVYRSARVPDPAGRPLPNAFAAVELVGGLFHDSHPDGAGLTAGAVFGRMAGLRAAGRDA